MEKKLIAFQVDIELYEKLRKSAYDAHASISEIIRNILNTHYLNEECRKKNCE